MDLQRKLLEYKQTVLSTCLRVKEVSLANPGAVGLLASILVPVILLTAILCFPTPPPIISIEAHSEYIAYRVARPEIAGMVIEQSKARPEPQKWGCDHLNDQNNIEYALVEPGQNTFVTYRFNGEQLLITLKSEPGKQGKIYFADEDECTLPALVTFTIQNPEEKPFALRPLPVAGPGQIGNALGKPTLKSNYQKGESKRPLEFMHGGQLQVYGRTANPFNRGTPYLVEEGTFTLPIGGRLISNPHWQRPDFEPHDDAIYGVALLKGDDMQLSLTTESDNLQLYRPGRSTDSEQYKVSVFAKLFDDPSIAPISLLILFISISLQAFCSWIGIWKKD